MFEDIENPLRNRVAACIYFIMCVGSSVMYIWMLKVYGFHQQFRNMIVYRLMFHQGVADCIYLIAHGVGAAFGVLVIQPGSVPSKILGAFGNGGYMIALPFIFVLALNRLTVLCFPHVDFYLFSQKGTTIWIVSCWIFGLANTLIYFTPLVDICYDIDGLWFYYGSHSPEDFAQLVTDIAAQIDLWAGQAIKVLAGFCYFIIFIFLVNKRGKLRTIRREIPPLIHFFIIFFLSTLTSILWHVLHGPMFIDVAKNYDVYITFFLIFRSAVSPFIPIISNKSIRSAMNIGIRKVSNVEIKRRSSSSVGVNMVTVSPR